MPEPLTSTEVRLLELLGRGFTQQEIATGLAMTVGTVKWRMRQIFGKLQARNRIEALARAREQTGYVTVHSGCGAMFHSLDEC